MTDTTGNSGVMLMMQRHPCGSIVPDNGQAVGFWEGLPYMILVEDVSLQARWSYQPGCQILSCS